MENNKFPYEHVAMTWKMYSLRYLKPKIMRFITIIIIITLVWSV